MQQGKLRIAATSDIHVCDTDQGKWKEYFQKVSEEADVLLICGDLTDHGKAIEAEVLAEELQACKIPVLAVLGNHDYERDEDEDIKRVLSKVENFHLLDGDSVVIQNVGFAGVKGFAGGFDRRKMPFFGEKMNKMFVQEVLNEADKLDRALQQIEEKDPNLQKVVIMHYSPIEETIVGEPYQIYPFMGSSHLAVPLEKRNVDVAFHGHAHVGTLKGITPKGVAVYNVSVSVLRNNGFKIPFYFLEM